MSKTITVELDERQEKFLKEFASKHYDGAEDNLYTVDAIHVVQTKRYDYIPYSDDIEDYFDSSDLVFTHDEDYEVWYDDEVELIKEYYAEWKDEDCPIEIKHFREVRFDRLITVEGEEEYIVSHEDYFKAYGIDIHGIAWRQEEWEDIAFFFIRDEAKRYINYQRHNLRSPRVYTYSAGYSNYGDFVPFRNLLLSIGEKLNKE